MMYQTLATNLIPMLIVMLLAASSSLISAGLTKLLIDTKEIERKQKQIRVHKEEKEKIIELADVDVNKYRKERKRWERKDVMIKKTEQRMGLQRFKPTCVTAIPLMIIMMVFNIYFGGINPAYSPMTPSRIPLIGSMISPGLDPGNSISYIAWYILCSMTMSSLINRLLKIQTQTSGGQLGQMFSGQKAKALEFPNV
ncbi:MAG: EMC3/TMCO1 family protein [Promethearchaeota archaeon]